MTDNSSFANHTRELRESTNLAMMAYRLRQTAFDRANEFAEQGREDEAYLAMVEADMWEGLGDQHRANAEAAQFTLDELARAARSTDEVERATQTGRES